MTIEEIREECNKMAAAQGVEITVPIDLNGRLKATLGRVSYKWDDPTENTVIPTSIEFSKDYLAIASDDEIHALVAHEMSHYILASKTHRRHGHDAMFKRLCKELGGTGERCTPVQRIKMSPKYSVFCSNCGGLVGDYYRAGKTVQHPDWYKTSCCKAPLRVVQNY